MQILAVIEGPELADLRITAATSNPVVIGRLRASLLEYPLVAEDELCQRLDARAGVVRELERPRRRRP